MYNQFAGLAVLLLQLPASIPAGTPMTAKLERSVNTASSQQGDEVVAVVVKNVVHAGAVVVPEGSLLRGRVETIQPARRELEGRVRLLFREIEFMNGRRIQTWITNSFVAKTPRRNARYVIYTALGATAGALGSGKRARVAGILGGAIVGFVIAGSRNAAGPQDLTLKAGQQIELQLGEDLVMTNAKR
jgi:hypothetical protein